MDYRRIYNNICNKANNEIEVRYSKYLNGEYFEGHHILPICLGGTGKSTNWKSKNNKHPNIIPLTAKEHFLCHKLLCKIYPNNQKLAYAYFAMCVQKNQAQASRINVSAKEYSDAKIHRSKLGLSDDHKRKIGLAHKGKTQIVTEETRIKLSAASKGKPKSEEWKQKIRKPKSEEWKQKNRKPKSNKDNYKYPKKKITCTVCGHISAPNIIHRYHLTNCKYGN
jgi:hypothetical protein